MTKLTHPHTGHPLKLGRNLPPPVEQRRMHLPFRKYVRRQMPKPPTRTNYRAKAQKCLSQVLFNDSLGCCTASGAFHILGSWFGNAGHPVTFSNDQVSAFYARSTGYVPGKPATDQGGNEIEVLDCWRDHGLIVDAATPLGRRKLLGHMTVEADNPEHMALAVWLFENGYGGASLPDNAVNDVPADNGVWDLSGAPNPNNGHCPPIVDLEDGDYVFSTWGLTLKGSAKDTARLFVPDAGGEMHVAFSEDMLDRVSHKAPNGFDVDALKEDLAAIGSQE